VRKPDPTRGSRAALEQQREPAIKEQQAFLDFINRLSLYHIVLYQIIALLSPQSVKG
jgi:hypothetical protein